MEERNSHRAFCLLSVFLLFSLMVPAAFADNEYKQTLNLRNQLGQVREATAKGAVEDDVDLLTGDVKFSLPLFSLPGRNGMDFGLGISYSSNFDALRPNSEAPTGTLGLGWSVGFGAITADTKGTGSNLDDTFYLGGKELVPVPGHPDEYYTARDYSYAKIKRFMNGERVERWEVTGMSGTKSIYGQSNTADPDNARWVVLGDRNHIGIGNDEYYVSWHLSKVQDYFGNSIQYKYKKYETDAEIASGIASEEGYKLVYDNGMETTSRYTKVMYPDSVTDAVGRTVKFNYGMKAENEYYDYDEVGLGYGNFLDNTRHYQMKGIQRLYLSNIEVKDAAGALINRYVFGYNENVGGAQQQLNAGTQLEKRLLTSVTAQADEGGQAVSLNPTKFEYQLVPQEFGGRLLAGNLRKVYYSNGGVVEYQYGLKELGFELDQAVTMQGLLADERQEDYLGKDYAVLKRVSATRAPRLEVYEFDGRGWKSKYSYDVPDYDPNGDSEYPAEVMDVYAGDDYFVAVFGDETMSPSSLPKKNRMQVFQRDREGTWAAAGAERVFAWGQMGIDGDIPSTGVVRIQTLPDSFIVHYGWYYQKIDVYQRNAQLQWGAPVNIVTAGGLNPPPASNVHYRGEYLFYLKSEVDWDGNGQFYRWYPMWMEKNSTGSWVAAECNNPAQTYNSEQFSAVVDGIGTVQPSCFFRDGGSKTFSYNILANDEYVAMVQTDATPADEGMITFYGDYYTFSNQITGDAYLYLWRRQPGGKWKLLIDRDSLVERFEGEYDDQFAGYFLSGGKNQFFVGNSKPGDEAGRLLRYAPICPDEAGAKDCMGWQWGYKDSIGLPPVSTAYYRVEDLAVSGDKVALVKKTNDTSAEGGTYGKWDLLVYSRDRYGNGNWEFANQSLRSEQTMFESGGSIPNPPSSAYDWLWEHASVTLGGDTVSVKGEFPWIDYVPFDLGSMYIVSKLYHERLQYSAGQYQLAMQNVESELLAPTIPSGSYAPKKEHQWLLKGLNQNFGRTALFQKFLWAEQGWQAPVLYQHQHNQVQGPAFDFYVARKIVSDGYGNTTTYEYDFKNGKYDKHLGAAQYNYAEVKVENSVAQQENRGKVVHRFYNGLDDSDPCETGDCPDMGAFDYPEEMNGLKYRTTGFDKDGVAISNASVVWEVVPKQLGSYLKQAVQSSAVRDGVTTTTSTQYNPDNGLVRESFFENGANSVKSCTKYAFEVPGYAGMIDLNMLSQVYKQWSGAPGLDCSAEPEQQTYRVFIANTAVTGAISHPPANPGIESADAICNAEAASAGIGGNWSAWLSVYSQGLHARDRIPDGKYVRMDGAVVAYGKADLTDGTIQNPIDVGADGIPGGNGWAKTGTAQTGLATGDDCTGWTEGSLDEQYEATEGAIGSGHLDGSWTQVVPDRSQSCGQYATLYCFDTVSVSTVRTIDSYARYDYNIGNNGDPPYVLKRIREWNDPNFDMQVQQGELAIVLEINDYDSYGNVLEVSNALGNRQWLYYGDNGDTRDNNATGLAHAYVTATQNELGQWSDATYNSRGQMLYLMDENGVMVQRNGYDKFGRLEKVALTGDTLEDPTMEYQYHEWEAPTSLETINWVKKTAKMDADTDAVSYAYYDGLGRNIAALLDRSTGTDIISRTVYDDTGAVFSQTKASLVGQESTDAAYSYYSQDPARRVLASRGLNAPTYQVNQPLPQPNPDVFTYYAYDNVGGQQYRATATDAEGRLTQSITDKAGNLVKVIDAHSNEWNYAYDRSGNLLLIDPPGAGAQQSYQFEARGLLWRKQNPEKEVFNDWNNTDAYEYDANGQLVRHTTIKGTAWTAYDELGRITNVTFDEDEFYGQNGPLYPVQIAKHYYDNDDAGHGCLSDAGGYAVGRLCMVERYSSDQGNMLAATRQFGYDSRGRLVKEIVRLRNPRGTFTNYSIAYTYDNLGSLLTETVGTRIRYYYNYDDLGRLSNVTAANGPSFATQERASSFTYEPTGALKTRTTDAFGTTYSYNDRGWLQSIHATDGEMLPVFKRYYEYDGVGNVEKIYEGTQPLQQYLLANYSYDGLNRLQDVVDDGYYGNSYSYAYDEFGNRLSETNTVQPDKQYAYNTSRNNQLLSMQVGGVGTQFGYDGHGSLVSKSSGGQSTAYSYDPYNDMLLGADIGNNGTDFSFAYDEKGLRASKLGSNFYTMYLYDSAGNLVLTEDHQWVDGTPPGMSEIGKIAMECNYVNVHTNGSGWATDTDCASGCNVDPAEYCRKFYPGTYYAQEIDVTNVSKPFTKDLCTVPEYRPGTREFSCMGDPTVQGPQQIQKIIQPDPNVGKDAWISSAKEAYGKLTYVMSGRYWTGQQQEYRTFIEFPLDSIPANATILSAELQMRHYYGNGPNTHDIYRVAGAWGEDTITWDNQPASAEQLGTQYSLGGGWWGWNVQSAVQKIVNGSYSNYGFMIKKPNATNYNMFYSSDYAVALDRPKLVIVYSEAFSLPPQIPAYAKVDTFYVNGGGQMLSTARRYNDGLGLEFYLADHLQSTAKVMNESGMLVSSASYEPFGKEFNKQGADTRLSYTMKELDDGIGLYYYGARYYDADLGRFTSADAFGAGGNRYAYVNNNPMNLIDPTGHFAGLPGSGSEDDPIQVPWEVNVEYDAGWWAPFDVSNPSLPDATYADTTPWIYEPTDWSMLLWGDMSFGELARGVCDNTLRIASSGYDYVRCMQEGNKLGAGIALASMPYFASGTKFGKNLQEGATLLTMFFAKNRKKFEKMPVIVVQGRPGVGKSAFIKLAQERFAERGILNVDHVHSPADLAMYRDKKLGLRRPALVLYEHPYGPNPHEGVLFTNLWDPLARNTAHTEVVQSLDVMGIDGNILIYNIAREEGPEFLLRNDALEGYGVDAFTRQAYFDKVSYHRDDFGRQYPKPGVYDIVINNLRDPR